MHTKKNWIVYLKSSMLIMLFFVFNASSFSQEDECAEPNKKAKKRFDEAVKYNLKGPEAYALLKEAVEIDPEYAAAYSAMAYINMGEMKSARQRANIASMNQAMRAGQRAEKYWKKTIELCPSYRDYEAYFLLADYYLSEGKQEDATANYQSYIANTTDRGKDYNKAKKVIDDLKITLKFEKRARQIRDSLINNAVPFNPVRVKGVSTTADEYLPVLSPDNRYLFFTRREFVDTRSFRGKDWLERFTISKNNYNNSFSSGEPMPDPFNKGGYQGGVSVSVDNKLIFVTLIETMPHPSGTLFQNGNIYYSEFHDTAWTPLKTIGDHINLPREYSWEGQPSISADNKTLYFSSARDPEKYENYGGMDLYKVERQPNGEWGNPINLGPRINTSGNEKTPFLHSDSYTLYFSSDKHPGIGGFDIFYVKLDIEGKPTTPKNIGYPINTEEDEHGFVVSTDGKYGYFSSNLKDDNLDIYSFEIPEEAKPEDVAFVRGNIVSGSDAAKGLEITLKNINTKKEVSAVIDENTGEYVGVIAVKEGEDAIMTAKKEGYAFSSQYISSTENVVGKPIEKELKVEKIEVGQVYKINNINFATNSYALNPQAQAIISEFKEFLITNPSVKVKIQGHTDDVGKASDNLILSRNRAKAVKEFLVEGGIEASRLSSEGFGQNQPVADNNTIDGRAANRRTEFKIIEK